MFVKNIYKDVFAQFDMLHLYVFATARRCFRFSRNRLRFSWFRYPFSNECFGVSYLSPDLTVPQLYAIHL